MRKNPVLPYAIIALLGVLAVVIISFVGIGQRDDLANEGQNGEETQEGETAGSEEEIFQANCAACHGADLSGGAGPDLTQVGSKYSAEEIAEIIQEGLGSMPGGLVQGEEQTALAEWLSEME